MSNMKLKFRIVPSTNNQEVKIYCDDPHCLNRQGCLYADGTKGILTPHLCHSYPVNAISRVVCPAYNPPSDTPVIKTRESKGFEESDKHLGSLPPVVTPEEFSINLYINGNEDDFDDNIEYDLTEKGKANAKV